MTKDEKIDDLLEIEEYLEAAREALSSVTEASSCKAAWKKQLEEIDALIEVVAHIVRESIDDLEG